MVENFLKWEAENNIKWLASELQVGSLLWQYCGILDGLCQINGRNVLLDFKTSNTWKSTWVPQLIGLKVALEEMWEGEKIDEIATVRLARDGEFEYKPIKCDYETEFMAFLKAKAFLEERNKFKSRWAEA